MTKGANSLGISQSAATQIIQKLEESLQVELFDRSKRPMSITAAGHLLNDRAAPIIKDTAKLIQDMQSTDRIRLRKLTIAMSDSMDAIMAASLHQSLKDISLRLHFWAGLSPNQREDFLAHDIDIMISTRSVMEDVADIERHYLFKEPYVLIFPTSYKGSTEMTGGEISLPFLRYSQRSAIGRRIELQLNRLRLEFPKIALFDTATAHIKAVAAGNGWGITTPLCLLQNEDQLDKVAIHPITRGAFSRHFDLLARSEYLEDIPAKIALKVQTIFETECLPKIQSYAPWLDDSYFLEETTSSD